MGELLYKKNKTMKILGQQYPSAFLGDEQVNALKDIHEAYRGENHSKMEIMVDAFSLGFIYGKRAERNKEPKKIRQAKNKGYINIG